MKIGHKKAFWLLFLNCFKTCSISFTLTCITGNYFTIVWADTGRIHLIWGHIGILRIIWTHLDWFKIIWDKLGSFGLPWLLVSLLKILFHLNLFFIWTAFGWSLRRHGKLSLIYLYSSRGKEIGFTPTFCRYQNICKLKTQELQVKCKWNLHDICTTLAPFISKEMRVRMEGQARGTSKTTPKMSWNSISLLFNITWK